MDNNKVNNVTNNTEDLSFLEDSSSGLQFKDILFLVIRNLPWFILCALIGAAVAFYKVKGEEKIYLQFNSGHHRHGIDGFFNH